MEPALFRWLKSRFREIREVVNYILPHYDVSYDYHFLYSTKEINSTVDKMLTSMIHNMSIIKDDLNPDTDHNNNESNAKSITTVRIKMISGSKVTPREPTPTRTTTLPTTATTPKSTTWTKTQHRYH